VAEQDFQTGGSDLVRVISDAAPLAELSELEDAARHLARGSRADSTWRAYDSDFRHFQAWCSEHGLSALPAEPLTVATYLAALESSHSPSTIRRRLAAISVSHQLAGLETPTGDAGVKSVWAGIRRCKGVAPRKVRAARTKVITALVAPLGNRLIDVRDRTLILIGFAGALRRSELVALDIDDVGEDAGGLVLSIRRSKTDQEAEGAIRGLPYGSHPGTCPVRAWRAWIDASDITTGPAFRGVDRHGRLRSTRLSDRAVADIIKRRAARAGLDGSFAGHSLRSGFATEGYSQGTPELAIMRHGRWNSASVMRGYVQEGTLWSDNPAARLGL
jgi:site-specific recombinase XerD